MGLRLNSQLVARLKEVRKNQLQELHNWPGAEDILQSQDVICVRQGFGCASFIGLDGRAYFWNYADGHRLEELTDPISLANVVQWGVEIGIPELLESLPSKPGDGLVCSSCHGIRWEKVATKNKPSMICNLCHGLGWVQLSETQ